MVADNMTGLSDNLMAAMREVTILLATWFTTLLAIWLVTL
jgi:hypothetical protein